MKELKQRVKKYIKDFRKPQKEPSTLKTGEYLVPENTAPKKPNEGEGMKPKQSRQQRLAVVCEATGWDKEIASDEMARAKSMGLKETDYVRNKAWELDDEDLEQLIKQIKRRERNKELRKQKIAFVSEITGWDKEHVKAEMARVKELGFNQREYIENECWALSDEEIVKLIDFRDSVAEREELIKDPFKYICLKTGWDDDFAEQKISEAKALGISKKEYADYEVFDLNKEQLTEFSEVLKEIKQREKRDQEFYIKVAVDNTGWSYEEAKAHMDTSLARGITPMFYGKHACWNLDFDKIEKIGKNTGKKIIHTKEKYLRKIMEETSWSRGYVELQVNKARNVSGCNYNDYYLFRFHEITPDEQKTYVTLDLFSKMRTKYNDRAKSNEILNNKVNFNKTYADCINRKWFYNRDLPYEEFLRIIEGVDAVVVKPLNATQGKGIVKIDCRVKDEEKPQLYERIMGQKESIVEEYIVQHEELMAFSASTVNTLRMTTLNANGRCNYLYALLRLGKEGAVADNMHAGGIACGVDLKTGITITHAVGLDGSIYPEKPNTDLKTKGFQIPHWDKIIETCEKIYDRVEGVNIIGWDFAITPDGVDLIEGNPGTSYLGAQILYIQDRVGLRDVMVGDYLD